jgi:hypothetical protein
MTESHDELNSEAAKIVSAVQDWARKAFSAQPGAQPPAERAAGAGECVPWCPICQFAGILRGEHPEVTERLAEAGAALAGAMKVLSEAALARAQAGQQDGKDAGRPRPAPRVQHIRIDEPDES